MGLGRLRHHQIGLDQARQLTRRYRALYGNARSALVTGVLPREGLDTLLAQPGCLGVRFYGGAAPEGTPTLLFVATDAEGRDLANGIILALPDTPPLVPAQPDDGCR